MRPRRVTVVPRVAARRQQLQPWKRHRHTPYTAEKLLIPLPLPHPARIAAIVYNRDTDEPVAADGQLSAAMFAALEGAEPTAHAQTEGAGRAEEGARVAAEDETAAAAGSESSVGTVGAGSERSEGTGRERERSAGTGAGRADPDMEESTPAAAAAAAAGRGEPHVVVIPLGDLAAAAELGAGDLLSRSVRTTDV